MDSRACKHLLPAILLATWVIGNAEARAPAQQLAPMIRVKLGLFSTFKVQGYDLRINQRARLEDHRRLDVSCRTNNANNSVVLGAIGNYPSPLTLEASGGFIFVNGNAYRDRVIIHSRENGQCLVVNETNLEHYVAGVVNNEMHGAWPIDALKAQAISARSYALYEVERQNRHAAFHVESTTKDQVFGGASTESERASLATQSTRGVVLLQENATLKAYYHANCGGRTDLPENVWGERSSQTYKSVACPHHHGGESTRRWSWEVDLPQLESALRRTGGILPGGFTRIAAVERGTLTPGNRLKNVVVSDFAGRRALVPANLLRQSLGFLKVKSAKFELNHNHDRVEFRGVGFGHGVGLCQVGAKEMAARGKRFQEILGHYYPLARLGNLY